MKELVQFCVKNTEIPEYLSYYHKIIEMSKNNAYNREKILKIMTECIFNAYFFYDFDKEILTAWINMVGEYTFRVKTIARNLEMFHYAEQMFYELMEYYVIEA